MATLETATFERVARATKVPAWVAQQRSVRVDRYSYYDGFLLAVADACAIVADLLPPNVHEFDTRHAFRVRGRVDGLVRVRLRAGAPSTVDVVLDRADGRRRGAHVPFNLWRTPTLADDKYSTLQPSFDGADLPPADDSASTLFVRLYALSGDDRLDMRSALDALQRRVRAYIDDNKRNYIYDSDVQQTEALRAMAADMLPRSNELLAALYERFWRPVLAAEMDTSQEVVREEYALAIE